MRIGTAYNNGQNNGARPMTSNRAAGFSRAGRNMNGTLNTTNTVFDPLNQASSLNVPEKTDVQVLEEKIKVLEKSVNTLIEESCFAADEENYSLGLDKAKEAGKKERQLSKLREENGLQDQINLDLTYCVLLNLANMYHSCRMYQESLNTYNVIIKNKLFNQSGRLRVNMGNIHFEQKNYTQAIKMYRMALDQLSNTNRDMR